MLSIGDTIRDYEVFARLQSGGMGEVFLARKVGAAGFSRPVALKVMHDELAEEIELVELFIAEAQLAARIHHPHVVHVEEFGEHDGTYFLAMEYVPGCSLVQLLRALHRRGARIPVEMAVLIAAQIADGLRAVHEARDEDGAPLHAIHRDVSPQNILLAENGYAKLIDFGVAKSAGGRGVRTASGLLRGKLSYMAPEQAHAREVDARTDLYALGVVLWEMLTGQRLFRAADDIALLELVRAPVHQPPSARVPGVPAALDAVVLSALAREPDERPASASAFRRALLDAMPGVRALGPEDLGRYLGVAMVGARISRPSEITAPRGGITTEATDTVPAQGAPVVTAATLAAAASDLPDRTDPSGSGSTSASAPARRSAVRARSAAMATAFAVTVGAFASVWALRARPSAPAAATAPVLASQRASATPAAGPSHRAQPAAAPAAIATSAPHADTPDAATAPGEPAPVTTPSRASGSRRHASARAHAPRHTRARPLVVRGTLFVDTLR